MSVQDPLRRLLRQMEPAIRVIGRHQQPAAFDCHCPLMSPPLAMGTTLEIIPSQVPCLLADPERSAAWRKRLAALPGRKVGLVWAGAPQPEHPRDNSIDPWRSITLYHYAPLAKVPGLCLVSLQKGEAAGQARLPPSGIVLHDWTAELEDFADTAALVEALDLVISVDISVMHLVGALGKPIWVLNRFDQCWRWLSDRPDSPWYPPARLFGQPEMGNWEAVIEQVRRALRTAIDGGDEGLPTLAQIHPTEALAVARPDTPLICAGTEPIMSQPQVPLPLGCRPADDPRPDQRRHVAQRRPIGGRHDVRISFAPPPA